MTDSIRVLHVDDDPHFSDLTGTFLERADERITVDAASSASDALDTLAENDYECVVSDYDMPGQNGIDFLESIRSEYPDLPFILFTGKGSEEVASEAISAGVTDYLQKTGQSDQYTILANRIVNTVESARAKATAQQSQDRLQTLSEAFPDLILYLDEEGQYLDALAGSESQLLYESAQKLIGQRFHDVLPAETADRFLDTVRSALDTGELHTIEYQLDVQAGLRWFEARIVPLSERRVVVWVARDITEHKERERTLTALHTAAREIGRAEDAETVYETLVEAAKSIFEFDVVVVDVERDGFLVQETWTVEADDRGGYEQTSLEEDDTLAVRAYNRQETILVDDLRDSEITPAAPEFRSALTVPIGEFGTFQAVSTKVGAFAESDREFAELLVGHAGVKLVQLQGRQQLRERTAELELQNERLDEFASVVSHDLRNPLNTLTLSLDLAERTADSEHFRRCQRAVDRMDELIEGLLGLARERRHTDAHESISLVRAVGEAWGSVETGGAELVVQADQTVDADRTWFSQLLENLLHNAVEHGGDVTVTVGDLERGFFVEDTGPGIPESERERIFTAGYSTAADGVGFGLRIVEQVVEAHDWDIRLTDGTDGGTRFEILTDELDSEQQLD